MKILTSFKLTDLDCPEGATLVIKPLSKQAAQQLVRAKGADPNIIAEPARQLDRITDALCLPFVTAAQVKLGETVLVADAQQWNNIRFFTLEFIANAHGEMAPAETDPFET